MFMDYEELERHKQNYTKINSKQFCSLYDMENREVLGRGTFGEVSKTVNHNGNEVAVKLFNSNAQRQIKQIIREVDNLKLLNHTNIAKFYDCYLVDKTQYFIVMEYCPGGSLTSYLKTHSLKDSEKIQICHDISQGLAYAHQMKVIHRDLKPDNILIGKKGFAKICDFGCSTTLESHNEGIMETIVGSPAYWDRPISNSQTYDQTVDIYAMGMIFYSIFKGKGIYDECHSQNQMNKLRHQIDENYEQNMDSLLKGIPYSIAKIIKNCMHTDSRQRYTAREISNILKTEVESKSSSNLSKLMSTIESEEIEDDESQFVVGLVAQYRKVDQQNNKLGSRRTLLELLKESSSSLSTIEVLFSLKHIEPKTKEQFFVQVVFYYFHWLSSLKDFINETNPVFEGKYPQIVISALQEEVKQTAFNHIQGEYSVYQRQFQKCCKNINRRIKLLDSRIYMPEVLKKIVGKVASGIPLDYGEFEEQEIKEEMREFFEKRMVSEFRRSLGNHEDQKSSNDLLIIKQLTLGI